MLAHSKNAKNASNPATAYVVAHQHAQGYSASMMLAWVTQTPADSDVACALSLQQATAALLLLHAADAAAC